MPSLPTHIAVQRLNNRAAFHLERDEYEMAIELLIDALKIWETVEDYDLNIDEEEEGEEEGSSSSSRFSVDECILQARNLSPQIIFRRRNQQSQSSQSTKTFYDNDDDSDDQQGFIYRQPILTTKQFWKSNDIPPTNTLSLILILNLAMAHHLYGLKQSSACTTLESSSTISTPALTSIMMSRRKKILQKALQLYELAHQLQIDNDSIFSPQATMIIANNVGEIHRAVNNNAKHEMCLQHLLQTMMYMVDNHVENHHSNNSDLWDGFLRNTSQLILQQNCAGAA